MPEIDRKDPFWRALFFEAWKQAIVPRDGKGADVLAGATIAKQAAAMADDAMTHALGVGQADACEVCKGVGCQACKFLGVKPRDEISTLPPPPAGKCRACQGTGHKGTMGDDGSVHFDPSERCPACKGSGEYSGGLVQAISNEPEPPPAAPTQPQ